MHREMIVEDLADSERLDRYLARKLTRFLSRSQIKKIIETGHVRVQGREVAARHPVKLHDRIEIQWEEKKETGAPAQDIPLEILYEDKDLLLVNKPAGMVVHPGNGNADRTLVNALLFHIKKLSKLGGTFRPGIVHRLDKDTSGIMLIARNDKAHHLLAGQFKDQSIERIYRVVVKGLVQRDEGICEEPVGRAFLNRKKIIIKPSGGKEALTYYKVLERYQETTLLELRLHTGRTHQIRVHMRHMGHPVLGDALYGVKSSWISRQAVHAFALGFIHPTSGKRIYQECPLPGDIEFLLKQLAVHEQ